MDTKNSTTSTENNLLQMLPAIASHLDPGTQKETILQLYKQCLQFSNKELVNQFKMNIEKQKNQINKILNTNLGILKTKKPKRNNDEELEQYYNEMQNLYKIFNIREQNLNTLLTTFSELEKEKKK